MVFLNSAINPLAYGYGNETMQKAFRITFPFFFKGKVRKHLNDQNTQCYIPIHTSRNDQKSHFSFKCRDPRHIPKVRVFNAEFRKVEIKLVDRPVSEIPTHKVLGSKWRIVDYSELRRDKRLLFGRYVWDTIGAIWYQNRQNWLIFKFCPKICGLVSQKLGGLRFWFLPFWNQHQKP